MIDNLNFDVKISIQLVKQIFGFNLSLEEIKEIEPKLYSELSNLLKTKNYDGLSFIIKVTDEKGNQRIDELLFNGNDIKVTDNNINDYIQKRINYQLKNYNEAIIEIAQAFYEHFPKSLFVDFMPEELKTLFNSLG